MKRWLALGALGIVVVLLLVAAAPADPSRYEAPIPAEERARNAAILTALAAVGIERAWVDGGVDPVLVVYERPERIAVAVAQAYALASAAAVASDASSAIARTTEGAEWRVAVADVLAYQRGEIDRQTLETRVLK